MIPINELSDTKLQQIRIACAYLFSASGHRTVLVDLDLGGANLHLYLGETSLRHTINDFLTKEMPS